MRWRRIVAHITSCTVVHKTECFYKECRSPSQKILNLILMKLISLYEKYKTPTWSDLWVFILFFVFLNLLIGLKNHLLIIL